MDFKLKNNDFKLKKPGLVSMIHIEIYTGVSFKPSRGGGPRVAVSTAAFHARVRGSIPGLGGLKETKMFLPHPRVKLSIMGSLCAREVACSASDRQGSNFESCAWRTVSSHSSHNPQEVLLAQFNLYEWPKARSISFHLNPHDAAKHHFSSVKNDIISYI